MKRIIFLLAFLFTFSCGEKKSSISQEDVEKIYVSLSYSAYVVKSIRDFLILVLSDYDYCTSSSGNEKFYNCMTTSPYVVGVIKNEENIYYADITAGVIDEETKFEGKISGNFRIRGEGLELTDISVELSLIGKVVSKGEIDIRGILFSDIQNGFSLFSESGVLRIYWTDEVNILLQDFRYIEYTEQNTSYVRFSGNVSFGEGNTCIGKISGKIEGSVHGAVGSRNFVCPSGGKIKFESSEFSLGDLCEKKDICQIFVF